MKKLLTVFAIFATMMLTGCYEQVPAGHMGKIMGKNGFQPEVIPPSKIWLETTFTTVPEKLFLVETTTKKFSQPFKILLKDKLTLRAEVVFRGRIRGDKKNVNFIFNDMTMNDNVVTYDEVYNTYGKMVVLNTAREVISQYNVDEVNQNYARITTELYQALEPKLENLPIEISDVTIGDMKYPDIVTDAIEKAKKRRMEIEETEATVQKSLKKKAGDEELAKADYRIEMLKAKRIRDYNKMTAEGITSQLLELRKLELREKELDKWDGHYPLNATTVMGTGGPVIVDTTK